MKLSIVIPARNEEGCIERTISDLVSTLLSEQVPYEILVVDDGSTDRTVEVARRLGLTVLSHEKNKGYGCNQIGRAHV